MVLSKLSRRSKKFFKLRFKDKLLVIRILYLSAFFRMVILLVPFKKISKHLGAIKEESKYIPNNEEMEYIKRISFFIMYICGKTPWESKCLVQAIIAQKFLSSKNIESTLYLGVRKDSKNNNSMIAHAWVKCNDFLVTGVSNEEFGIVAKYRK